jgi:hypothetical protein
MNANLILLDVAPDPVSPVMVAGRLILVLGLMLMFAVTGILGFIFLLKWFKKRKAAISTSQVQPNNPNHR